MAFVTACGKVEIPAGSAKLVEVGGKQIALFNLGGEVYALDNACTHVGGPLSQGTIDGEEIVCPLHGARFKIKDGSVTCPPAAADVVRYNVRVEGEDVQVEVG